MSGWCICSGADAVMVPLISLLAAAWGPTSRTAAFRPPMPLIRASVEATARPLVEARDDISKSMRAVFESVDLDSNDQIDRSEMKAALLNLGMSLAEKKTDALFDAFEPPNGAIDYTEFEELLLSASFDPTTFTENDFKAAFDAVDADSNGFIDRAELQASLDRLSASTIEGLPKETMTELFDAYDEECVHRARSRHGQITLCRSLMTDSARSSSLRAVRTASSTLRSTRCSSSCRASRCCSRSSFWLEP